MQEEHNSQYIKQGTSLWQKQREKARVTGSTLHSAINGHQAPPPSVQLQQLFDHGKKNEVNTIATLVSTAAPALLPDCYAFFEVGPKFIHSPN